MDAFGHATVKPSDNRTALSPIYQGRHKFSLYDNVLEENVGSVSAAPHPGAPRPRVELNGQYSGEVPDVRLLMEHAEHVISEFYSQEFPSYEVESPADLGLVEAAERALEGEDLERRPGMYEF